jgi:hypothetical protein
MEVILRPFKRMRLVEEEQTYKESKLYHMEKLFATKRKFQSDDELVSMSNCRSKQRRIEYREAASIKIQKTYRGWNSRRNFRFLNFPFYSH